MQRYFYSNSIEKFLSDSEKEILGHLVENSLSSESTEIEAWKYEIQLLKKILQDKKGKIYFEFSIPRMGRRIDVVLIIDHVVFILEFKVGSSEYHLSSIEQVWDYALDLKNFHATSLDSVLIPILIATNAKDVEIGIRQTSHDDKLFLPIKSNSTKLLDVIDTILNYIKDVEINHIIWEEGRYSPTPTIIEAARSLYSKNTVANISRNDSTAKNLSITSKSVIEIIDWSRINSKKSICFVTGVPGAGKTLVGLDIATKNLKKGEDKKSVFLSGNGPLVDILREALVRDKVKRDKELKKKSTKKDAFREVKLFIQNVHHYRDAYLADEKAPFDHVAIFDEAQRAWNIEQTVSFMKRKKNVPNFSFSEPEFLISCLDRHKDWAVIVCLVGGGQEINKGEAGISEWLEAIERTFPHWNVFVSPNLHDSEYAAGKAIDKIGQLKQVHEKEELHLSVSLRSFRTEHLSNLIKSILDIDLMKAKEFYNLLKKKYPIVLTRDIAKAKEWMKEKARGSERYGMVVSSQAERLKKQAIFVKSPMDPVHWFLNEKTDTRSSYFLEDVATEFHVQGLELDWSCVVWDADFRFSKSGWKNYSFVGEKWNRIMKDERQQYQKNAYRVLLTRARQGMVIVVPEGDSNDLTRLPEFYDTTFEYLKSIDLVVI